MSSATRQRQRARSRAGQCGFSRRSRLPGSPVRRARFPCKFFYDERGAELFQKICELPEYYITRTETADSCGGTAAKWPSSIGAQRELIGFGTGAGIKTRMLLEHCENPIAYVPVDISKQRLKQSAA